MLFLVEQAETLEFPDSHGFDCFPLRDQTDPLAALGAHGSSMIIFSPTRRAPI
jgi:hypothetical protein